MTSQRARQTQATRLLDTVTSAALTAKQSTTAQISRLFCSLQASGSSLFAVARASIVSQRRDDLEALLHKYKTLLGEYERELDQYRLMLDRCVSKANRAQGH